MSKARLTVYLSDSVADRLAIACKRPGANKSKLVDRALDRFLGGDGARSSDQSQLRRSATRMKETRNAIAAADDITRTHTDSHLAWMKNDYYASPGAAENHEGVYGIMSREVNTNGNGKTFGTTLGHSNATMQDPVYLDLVTRGLLWACGKLDDNGKPKPGYEAPAK